MWRNIRFLVRYDLKRQGWGILCSVIFFVYFCLFGSVISNDLFGDAEAPDGWDRFLTDTMFLTGFSIVGFMLSGDYRSYWRTDIFSQKLLFLRTLPIRTSELVAARYVQMLLHACFLSLVFFIPFAFFSELGDRLSGLQYVSFALVWIGYGLFLAGLFIYKEMTASGRSYLYFSMWLGLLYVVAAAVPAWLGGTSLVELSAAGAERYGLLLPAALWVVLLLWLRGWASATIARIARRHYRV